jgi:hypothetical protein
LGKLDAIGETLKANVIVIDNTSAFKKDCGLKSFF